MTSRNDYPEFSNISSHLQRAQARRSLEIGYALADALIDAGEFLGRAFKGVTQFIVALHKKALRFAKRLAAPRRPQQREA